MIKIDKSTLSHVIAMQIFRQSPFSCKSTRLLVQEDFGATMEIPKVILMDMILTILTLTAPEEVTLVLYQLGLQQVHQLLPSTIVGGGLLGLLVISMCLQEAGKHYVVQTLAGSCVLLSHLLC